ncbi:MAG TPA: phosphatase [Actinomycetota bacterium]|nr:phosphatase [Actinomycetota bacterium]
MTDDEVVARLIAGGLAGPHQSHSEASNRRNAGMLATGDTDFTFGMAEVTSASAEDALAAVAAVTGAAPGAEHIDPAATIAGIRAAAARLKAACRQQHRIFVATGHPTGLLVHHGRLVRALERAGASIVRPMDGQILYHHDGRALRLEYFGGVAALTDGANVLHTHLPNAMEHVLEHVLANGDGPEAPDLVFADHGFAGAAVARGVPAIAIMDTNDPALAVAAARGRGLLLIPMDDNRRPDAYGVVAELFEEELQA